MLNNAGKKITFWANVLLYLGIGISFVIGLVMIWNGAQINTYHYTYTNYGYMLNTGMMGGGRAVLMGFLVIVFGSLLSWLWALLLRAFGDLVTDTRAIREQMECACFDVETYEDEEAAPAAKEAAPAEKPTEAAAEEPEAK